jgi:hypothetical protein
MREGRVPAAMWFVVSAVMLLIVCQTGANFLAAGGGEDLPGEASEGACVAGARRGVTRRFSEIDVATDEGEAASALPSVVGVPTAQGTERSKKRTRIDDTQVDSVDTASDAGAAEVAGAAGANPDTITTFSFRLGHLHEIPGDVMRFSHLIAQDLSFNKLKCLPAEFRSFRLEDLDLRGNCLDCVPEELRGMTSLQKLDLEQNLIEILPDSSPLWSLTELTELCPNACGLRALSKALGQLTNLRVLDLGGNELACALRCALSGPSGEA